MEKTKNPYFDGRKEWMERYGDFIKGKRNWQIVAFISLFISLISVLGLIYIGSQNKLVPYVVRVDKLGQTQGFGKAVQIKFDSVLIRKSNLADFVENWRSLWGNIEVQKKFIFDTYKFIKPNSDAYSLVSREYKKEEPFQKLQSQRVHVKIKSILKMSKDNYQVDWTEEVTSKSGKLLGEDNYKGLFTIEHIDPVTEQDFLDNPMGNFVTEIHYNKIL